MIANTSGDIHEAVHGMLAAVEAYGPDGSWSETAERDIFDRLVNDGWARVGLAGTLGGDGGDLRDAAALVAACAASGHLLPFADIVIGTAQTAAAAGLVLPAGAVSVLPVAAAGSCGKDGLVRVHADRVPWARWATHLLVVAAGGDGERACLVEAMHAEIRPGHDLAGQPRDSVIVGGARPSASARAVPGLIDQLRRAGALARSIQMAAAVSEILRMTSRFCAQRRQFGRPLAAFQAVQQQLAVLAGESAAAGAAVAHALDEVGRVKGGWPVEPIAIAKVRTGKAAGIAAMAAHQLHGAIGITQEYPLHRYTRALWSWRDEYGAESYWARALFGRLTAPGAETIWPRIASAAAVRESS